MSDQKSAAAQRAVLRARRRKKVLADAATRMTRVGGTAADVPDAAPSPAATATESAAPSPAAAPVNGGDGGSSGAFGTGGLDPAFMQAMQQQSPELAQQMAALTAGGAMPGAGDGGQAAGLNGAAGSAQGSLLPANAGTYVAVSFGLLAGLASLLFAPVAAPPHAPQEATGSIVTGVGADFSGSSTASGTNSNGRSSSLATVAFPAALYVLLSVEVFGLVTGPTTAGVWYQQGKLATALAVGRTVAATSRHVAALVFVYLAVLVLQTQLRGAGVALAAALDLDQTALHLAWCAAAVVVGLVAALGTTFVVAAQRQRGAVVDRFTELALLMLRHERQMAGWAAGHRTTFEQEEATPHLERKELRRRVLVQLNRAEPSIDAAAIYDGRIEPALLRRPTVHRRQERGEEVFEYTSKTETAAEAARESDEGKQTLEAKRQARLAKAAEKAAARRAAVGGAATVTSTTPLVE